LIGRVTNSPDQGLILEFEEEKYRVGYHSVGADLGFQLDTHGRIKESKR